MCMRITMTLICESEILLPETIGKQHNYTVDRMRVLLPSPPVVFQLSRIMQGVLIVCLSSHKEPSLKGIEAGGCSSR